MRKYFAPLFLASSLFASQSLISTPQPTGGAVVSGDKEYYKHQHESNDVELIYPEENLPFAKHAAEIQPRLHEEYERIYDWKMDDTMRVGLISSCNQIANGFSTQWPTNRQINYLGGAMEVDYFSSTSWLDTLLHHESAHNYQVNVKDNGVSQSLNKLFRTGAFIIPVPLTVPNASINFFMLEGNAVLNESWHGHGGRLYSGRHLAQSIIQADADKIDPAYSYNRKLEFPYGDIVYIQGGFYNYYIAKEYGLEEANSFFKYNSRDFWWPFFTNANMEEAIGIDFEESMSGYVNELKDKAKKFTYADGELIVESQFFYPLNNDKESIFFLINKSGRDFPILVEIEKESGEVYQERSTFPTGKLIKQDGYIYAQSSRYTDVDKIEQGLFDEDAQVLQETQGKIIHGYLSDGREVYFDVASSFIAPQLYIEGEFIAQVNSSVYVAGDDIYYFKNEGKARTLYKNKTPLHTHQGFYGFVVGVDDGVYFIANSELGSTLYKYKDGQTYQVVDGDNIIDARLIHAKKLLVATVEDDSYEYKVVSQGVDAKNVYETKLFFEDEEYYGMSDRNSTHTHMPNLDEPYDAMFEMDYSGTNLWYSYSEKDGITGSVSANFVDPLTQNALNVFLSRDESNITLLGAGFQSDEHLLHYSLIAYGVVDDNERDNVRDAGVIADIAYPLYRAGYYDAKIAASYFQDFDTDQREPASIKFDINFLQHYGISMYANHVHRAQLYTVQERKDTLFGAKYNFEHQLWEEGYVNLGGQYSRSLDDISLLDAYKEARGVKFSNGAHSNDPATIYSPSLDGSFYLRQAAYIEAGLKQVLNISSYWFTFPLSLQRESFYVNYRYYDLESFSGYETGFNEYTLGTTLAMVWMNTLEVPLSLEYIHNDADFLDESDSFRFYFGLAF